MLQEVRFIVLICLLDVHARKGPISSLAKLFFLAEVDLQHSAIWMAGVYLMLLMQFLENKVAVELTRAEFVEAQEVGVCLWFSIFCQLLG